MTTATASQYSVERFGREGEPVVIIDDFSADAEALVSAAAQLQFEAGGPNYPGVRAPGKAHYLQARADVLKTVFTSVFGSRQSAKFAECNYSLVTMHPAQLSPVQRLPHFDSPDPACLAVLHYLCRPEDGGTAFYRHRATGFETITQDRMSGYFQTLNGELARDGAPPETYPDAETAQFEQIGRVEARFNRLVIYRGQTLHSGQIPADLPLLSDPARGRLTLNTFIFAR